VRGWPFQTVRLYFTVVTTLLLFPQMHIAGGSMEQRQSFEKVAELYAGVRRGYPAALFDDLGTLADLGPSSRVLEVGCGGGQATGDLAARAQHVLALDPGERLVAEARKRVPAANVEFVVSTFEHAAVTPGAFDLIASAQAWHWVDQSVAFGKAAQALAPSGHLAVFGHVPMSYFGPLRSILKSVYETRAPGIWGMRPPQTGYLPDGPFPAMFAASGLFEAVVHRGYPWTWSLDPDTFGRYLRTDSSYHILPEAARFALFDGLAAAVAENGGTLQWSWETHLYVAQKR
jgi:SAM-dependent methyltransferase